MSSPPRLRDAFNEAGWTVVTRQSRNRQQGSWRRGCSDKSGMVLGSLWDGDNDMILEQVADDRTKKGMVKISAVVDSGAEANALPGEHDAVDSTEAQSSLKARNDLPRRCPVKRPLLRVAKIKKAGNQVYLGEDKAFVKNNKTGQITNLRRERNVWLSFQRLRR